MLPDRIYVPTEGDIIYHYCSSDSFLAICTSQCLRFSDVFAMNDFMEMYWGYHMWERAAGAMLASGKVERALVDDIDAIVHESTGRALSLAACFSRNGDVLSQWRAYADDGTGYALGFKAAAMVKLAVHPLRVEYDPETQLAEIKSLILALHEVESTVDKPRGPEFFESCARLAFDLAALKNPAVSEEDEVRLVRLVNFEPSNSSLRLVDPGGTAVDKSAEPHSVVFHASKGIPVAHVDLDFTNSGAVSPISDVVLGPRNEALPSGVSIFLETLGIPNVKVRKSAASYR